MLRRIDCMVVQCVVRLNSGFKKVTKTRHVFLFTRIFIGLMWWRTVGGGCYDLIKRMLVERKTFQRRYWLGDLLIDAKFPYSENLLIAWQHREFMGFEKESDCLEMSTAMAWRSFCLSTGSQQLFFERCGGIFKTFLGLHEWFRKMKFEAITAQLKTPHGRHL